jgi:uncharacterized protein (TIGR03032 family)
MRAASPIANGSVALISGFDDDADDGGLFVYDGHVVERLDDLPTTGIASANGGLARVLRGRDDDPGSRFIRYEPDGTKHEVYVEGLVDPHDVAWVDGSFAVACAGANAIVFVSEAGEVERAWKAPGTRDAWHLNSLVVVDGELHVMAFGRFDRHREWAEANAIGTGFLMSVADGRTVVNGLSSPHHPRLVEGEWIVCNSGTGELLRIDHYSRVRARAVLAGWARGLAVADGALLVGESRGRGEPAGAEATIATVDRTSWEVVGRIPVPMREIYDIVVVPATLARALPRQRSGPTRVAPMADGTV